MQLILHRIVPTTRNPIFPSFLQVLCTTIENRFPHFLIDNIVLFTEPLGEFFPRMSPRKQKGRSTKIEITEIAFEPWFRFFDGNLKFSGAMFTRIKKC
jgi:hypothetical protein